MMETVLVWRALLIFVVLQLAWTLLIRTFPRVLGSAFLKRLEHQQNLKLEQTKAELQSAYSTLKTSVDFLSTVQSELRSKVITSVEPLWAAVLAVKSEFADVVLLDSVLLPNEIDDALQTGDHNTLIQSVEKYRDETCITKKMKCVDELATEKARLFAGDRLWLIFYIIRAVHGRLALLVHWSFEKNQYVDWRDDKGVQSLLEAVLSKQVIDSAKGKKVQGLQVLVAHLEAEFLKEAVRVMSGSQGFADSLSDLQATLQYEHQKLEDVAPQY